MAETLAEILRAYRGGAAQPVDIVARSYARIRAHDDPRDSTAAPAFGRVAVCLGSRCGAGVADHAFIVPHRFRDTAYLRFVARSACVRPRSVVP